MSARATSCARSPRTGGLNRLALALAGGIAFTAFAQSYYIPLDLRPPPPRVARAPRAGEPCDACGRILSIREISSMRGPATAPAAPLPGGDPGDPNRQSPIGAVIYLPLGGQGADKPYIGAVGTPEARERMRQTSYELALGMDDGTYRFVRRDDPSSFAVGDRVRWLSADDLELLVSN
jgi:hypothetical protein